MRVGIGKLGRGAESAVLRIEHAGKRMDAALQCARIHGESLGGRMVDLPDLCVIESAIAPPQSAGSSTFR